jgi:hypothetical protein
VDSGYDLYDAREHGGFPEPIPPTPQCAGEACIGQSATAPAAGSGGSASARSVGPKSGRARKHRICARRAVHRHVRGKARCVPRRSHRRAKRAIVRDERSGR